VGGRLGGAREVWTTSAKAMRLWLAATIGGEAQMTANRKPRIAVVGSNMVDLITYVNRMPARGETIEAPSFEMGHGGKGANQAIAAAKLGASVVMVTKVGDDMFADSTIKNFARFGVDTTHVERVSGRSSGVAPIMVEPSGENSILIVKGANSGLSPVDVERAAEDLKVVTSSCCSSKCRWKRSMRPSPSAPATE
jgi:sugar/nucleoside kinase (ribokinase family)